jgi:hypothetical protein
MRPYKLHLLQALKPHDKISRYDYFCKTQEMCDSDKNLMDRLVFSDEATLHLSGKVNRHNIRIWRSEDPHETVQHERDSPKVNVFCAMSKGKIYGPFFFAEATVNGIAYLDLLTEWFLPQLIEDENNFILQQDGAQPHFDTEVRKFLNDNFPRRWIGRASRDGKPLIHWPPRSPGITPLDFFLWGCVKNLVCAPPPLSLSKNCYRPD